MAMNTTTIYLLLRARDEASHVLAGLSSNMRDMSKEARAAINQQMAQGRSLIGIGAGMAVVGAAGLAFYGDAIEQSVAYNQQVALTQTQLDGVSASFDQLKKVGRDVGAAIPVAFDEIQPMLYDIFSSMNVNLAQSKVLLTSFSKAAVAGQVSLQDAGRATIGIMNAYHMKAQEVNVVNDVMFQLVRKGVGTYAQFAEVIGRVTPSAVKAGQSIQTVAGMMAFLTRNGLSAAMASSSAARALDALSNPQTQVNFKAEGMSVLDAKGKFKSMADVVQMLQKHMQGLTAPQRAKDLKGLFMGSGGTIQAMRFFNVAVTQSKELKGLTQDMINSKGAMAGAYNIMFKQPQTQVQLLKNNLHILMTEVGDELIPIFLKATQVVIGIIKWFNNLSPTIKKIIVYGGLFVAAFTLIAGVVLMVVGAWLMLDAAFAAMEISLAGVILTVGWVILAIAAIVVVIILVIKYHKQIWAFMKTVWADIVNIVRQAWTDIWNAIGPTLTTIWNIAKQVFTDIYNVISVYVQLWVAVIKLYLQIMYTFWKGIFTVLWTVVKTVWTIIYNVIKDSLLLIWAIIHLQIGIIYTFIKDHWNLIKSVTSTAWKAWKALIWTPVQDVYNVIKSVVTDIYNYIHDHWNTIKSVTKAAWAIFKTAIVQPVEDAYNGVVIWIDKIVAKIGTIAGKITAPIKAVTGLLNKLNPLNRNSPSIVDKTVTGWQAMDRVTKAGINNVMRSAQVTNGYNAQVTSTYATAMGPQFAATNLGPTKGGHGAQVHFHAGAIQTQEIDPTKHAADLGLLFSRRVAG